MGDEPNSIWIADNFLRVEGRSDVEVRLRWDPIPVEEDSFIPLGDEDGEERSEASRISVPLPLREPSPVVRGGDGIEGPWIHVLMAKWREPGIDLEWTTVYQGYGWRTLVRDLLPDTTYAFKMQRNGDDEWGQAIIAATKPRPPRAQDLHNAVVCNAIPLLTKIISSLDRPTVLRFLRDEGGAGCGRTPLMTACLYGYIGVARILLEAGADPRHDGGRPSPLMYSLSSPSSSGGGGGEDPQKLWDFLTLKGADWAGRDTQGRTLLHYAVMSGNAKALNYVMTKAKGRALLNLRDKFGWTPLYSIIAGGYPSSLSMAEALLKGGADPNIPCGRGRTTPLILSIIKEKSALLTKLLLKFGADARRRGGASGKTPWEYTQGLDEPLRGEVQSLLKKNVKGFVEDMNDTTLLVKGLLQEEGRKALERRTAQAIAAKVRKHGGKL